MKNSDLDKKCRWFREKLLKWHREQNRREMPWKGEKDPYRIWLSEIILQQTRVEQGWAYYERFTQQFPTIRELAEASDKKVMKCWEGLGYYARCRNLLHTARFISADRKGVFPSTYNEILALKGVGPYTAAAISSFAFNLPHAVVDGNVYRVLSRYHGQHTPIDCTDGKKIFQALAQQSLDTDQPGLYNQALMDFGATICKPQSPTCTTCPLQKKCQAFLLGTVNQLPIKSPAKPKKKRWFYYVLPTYKGKLPLQLREGADVWAGLWEPPLIESLKALKLETVIERASEALSVPFPTATSRYTVRTYKQLLSHQEIRGTFLTIEFHEQPRMPHPFRWFGPRQLADLPFPKMIQDHWKESDSNG